MAHFQNHQFGAPPTAAYGNPTQGTHEHGSPVGPRDDKYGNPLGHHGATTGITSATTEEYGVPDTAIVTTGYAATTAGGHGTLGHDYGRKEHHGVTGVLHRSASSSSSSSEDDGLGGRRKKGLNKKIKEKHPGSTTTDKASVTTAGTTYPGEHHQERGMIENIKDKLPGTDHKDDPHYSTTTHTTTSTTTPYGGGTAYTEEHHEKKGMMDKIKEKLCGGHH